MNATRIEMAARTLLRCRQQHFLVASLDSECTPVNLAEAYEIQDAVASLLGQPVVGYKVGLTNEHAQRGAGVHEPIVGRLFANKVLSGGTMLAPAHSRMRAVESEVTFELGMTLLPAKAPFKRSDVEASISNAYASIEVCDSRFVNCDDVTLASIVADNSNAGVLVLGDAIPGWTELDLDSLCVYLSRGLEIVTQGSTGNVLGNPLESLCWLANWLAARDVPLKAGQLVATGTCTPIMIGEPGDHFVASFGAYGKVDLTFARVQDSQSSSRQQSISEQHSIR